MKLSRDKVVALVVFCAMAIFFTGLYLYPSIEKRFQDPCFSNESPTLCLENKAHYIAMNGDIKGAIAFTADVIAPYNRAATHFAMHMVGMQAYDQYGSRATALALLPSAANSQDDYLTYEGYEHGLLMEYFKKEIATTPIMDLIHESCDPYWVKNVPYTEGFSFLPQIQCFHAVGHGVMYAYGDDISKALPVCAQLPYGWMQHFCASGALMEESYEYNPDYTMRVGPQPEASSMASLCESTPLFKAECSLFVGRSYLSIHRGDFAGAFATCATLTDQGNAASCRDQIATINITNAGKDFDLMHARCKTAGIFENECLINVGAAVKRGFAGKPAQQKDFCATLSPQLKSRCEATPGLTHVSLVGSVGICSVYPEYAILGLL